MTRPCENGERRTGIISSALLPTRTRIIIEGGRGDFADRVDRPHRRKTAIQLIASRKIPRLNVKCIARAVLPHSSLRDLYFNKSHYANKLFPVEKRADTFALELRAPYKKVGSQRVVEGRLKIQKMS